MSDNYLTINGTRADTGRLRVNDGGRWLVDLDFVGTPPVGAVTVRIGGLELKGTVARSSSYLGKARVRVLAGGYGWGKTVQARHYHHDGQQRRAPVLTQLAADVGETIDTAGDTATLRVDFARVALPAWRVLEQALGATPWRIDFDGVTRYGARPAASLGKGVEVLDADPLHGTLTLAAEDPSLVPIGAVVTDARLAAPLTIQSLDVEVAGGSVRIGAWGTA